METLEEFYRKTRPWGFWKPVAESLRSKGEPVSLNTNMGRDLLNVAVGIIWQTSLICSPIFLVIQDWSKLGVSFTLVLATSIFLKLNWYDHLRNSPEHSIDQAPAQNEVQT